MLTVHCKMLAKPAELKDMDTLGCVADLGPHVLLAGERSRFALKRIKGRRSSLIKLELTSEVEMRIQNR